MKKPFYLKPCLSLNRKGICIAAAIVLFSFFNQVSAQCYIGTETNPGAINPSGCNSGSVNLGSGADYNLSINANTYYDFTWANISACINGFCAQPLNGSGNSGSFTTNQTNWFSGSTTTLEISADRNGCWNSTSGVMTYRYATPGISVVNASPSPICQGSSLSLTSTSSDAAGLSWSGPNSFSASGSNNATVTNIQPAGAGQYTFTANNSGCSVSLNTSAVVVMGTPTATAGANLSTCANNPSVAFAAGASASNYSSVSWSTTGSGTITSPGSLTGANYNITPADITAGSITFTLTATGNAPCGSASSTLTLTIVQAPTANSGGNQTMCSSAGTITLAGTATNFTSVSWGTIGGTGVFTNGNSLSPTYTPSNADISNGSVTLTLTASGNSPCAAAVSPMTLTIVAGPTANAGGNEFTCSNSGTVNITGATATNFTSLNWTTTGSGTLTGAGTLTPSYTPSTADSVAGNIQFTLTSTGNAPCGTAVSNMTLFITPAPTVNAGPNQVICAYLTAVNITGATAGDYSQVTWSSSGTGIIGNVNSLNSASYTPSSADATAGSVILTLTATGNPGCSSVNSSKLFTINPLPGGTILPSTTSVCPYDSATLSFNFPSGIDPNGPFNVIYTNGFTYDTVNGIGSGFPFTVGNDSTPGTFNYTIFSITDANGCTQTSGLGAAQVIFTTLPVISSYDTVSALCFGGSTGKIIVTATNGTPPYSYSDDSALIYQSSPSFSGLATGLYDLAVMDNLGCSSFYQNNPVFVSQPPTPVSITDTFTNASCANVFDGTITAQGAGGTPPYTYALNGGPQQSSNVFSGLAAQTYTVAAIDANGCSATEMTTISNTYALSDSLVSQSNVSCFGGSDGSVTVELSGGVPPYSYSINGLTFQPVPVFSGLTAGNYVVILRDSKGCTAFLPVTITQPGLLTITIDSLQNVLCSGQAQGGIFITVSGGTSPYTFNWSNTNTNQNDTNLVAGTYNVTVLDAHGCNASSGATITQPVPLSLNIATYHNLTCFNDSSGYIYATANGGVAPYSYAWSNLAGTQDITGLSPNTYTLTVTDANGCQKTISQAITQPTKLTSSISSTPVTCNGASNGTVTLTPSGGTTPYSFLWSNGMTSQNLAGVGGGTYTVVITDANGCSTSNTITLAEPAAISLALAVTNVTCHGGTGSITTTVTGGTGSIGYSWSNFTSNPNLTAVAAGTYCVTITDGNLCTASACGTITQPTALVLNGTVTSVRCAGGNGGSVDITVNGGVFPYTYSWSNGATTQNINNLSGGIDSVTVTDANACQITASFTVNEPSAITDVLTGTNLTCHGQPSGTTTLTVSGGTPAYTFFWSNFSASQNQTGLAAGTYTVIITDANGCMKRDSITLTEPSAISLSLTVTNVSCHGGSNGSIATTVSGGTGLISYGWSNSTTGATLNNVAVGTYCVTITDANGCSVSSCATITQPDTLLFSSSTANVLCSGGHSGSIDIITNGGVFPYIYNWNNGDSTADIYDLAGGAYTLTITDANLCSVTASFTITAPSILTAGITSTNVTCHGAENGTAGLTSVSGGTAPYSYLWSNFQGSSSIGSLSGGLYYVIITDANGCTLKDSALVVEPTQLVLSTSVKQITCFNSDNGSIALTTSGGSPGYTYQWNLIGGNVDSIGGLSGATYVYTVSDTHNCSVTGSVELANPPAIGDNFIVQSPLCFGDSNGLINMIPSGGAPPYSFAWSNGDTTESITGPTGTYFDTITDTRGCSKVDSVVMLQPTQLFTSGVIKNVTCAGDGDGSVQITVYGGTLPYGYRWSDSVSTQNLYNISGGPYYVTVTDDHGCQVVSLYIVREPALLTLGLTATNTSCFGGSNGTVSSTVAGGTIPYHYLWNNFAITPSQTGLAAGLYSLQLTDSSGCSAFDSILISQPTAISITGLVNNAICFNSATGGIITSVSGGTPGYAYSWSNGATTADINTVSADPYILTVTDTLLCTASATFQILQPPALTVSLSVYDPVCNGGNSGALSAIVDGGVQPYNYLWSTIPADTTVTASHLPAGPYTVTVTDNAGCTQTAGDTITQPAPLIVTPSVSGVRCSQSGLGYLVSNVTGGTAPYIYVLNGIIEESDTFRHIVPGSYNVVVTDINGCVGTDTFTINAPSQISVTLSANDPIILTGMQTQLSANAVSDTNIIGYIWDPIVVDSGDVFIYSSCSDTANCSTPYVMPPFTTTFSVTVMNADSCTASDTITIIVSKEEASFIPTAFTPNGDGLNDRFQFAILGASTIDISIYNRWGEMVYSNANQANGIGGSDGWDGTNSGKPDPAGTYVYQMKVTYFDGTMKNRSGTITIVR